MRLAPLLVLLLAACTGKEGGDTADTAGTGGDTADTSGGETDTVADDSFLSATGTWNGTPFSVSCDTSTVMGARVVADGADTVNAVCTDTSTADNWSVTVTAVDPAVGTVTACDEDGNVVVAQGGTGGSYGCALGGTTGFSLTVEDVTTNDDDSVTWAGTFSMSGADAEETVSVAGDFRVKAPCGAGC